MAGHMKIVFLTCLLFFILMEEFKPVLAKKNKGQRLKQKVKILEASMAELKEKMKEQEEKTKEKEERIQALEECKGKCTQPAWS